MSAVIIILLILAILLVIFTLQNSFEISVSFFLWEIPGVPLVLLILCCVLLGYIIAAVYFYPRVWKLKRDLKSAQKANQKLEGDLESKVTVHEKPGPEGIELDVDENEESGFFKD